MVVLMTEEEAERWCDGRRAELLEDSDSDFEEEEEEKKPARRGRGRRRR